jgi:hypothetical protein
MDNALGYLEKLLQKLTVQEKVNFVRIPLVILWLICPLSLYGYIITQDMLLYKTFLVLIITNLIASIVIYYLVCNQTNKEIKETFKCLNTTITHIKNQLSDLIGNFIPKNESNLLDIPNDNSKEE